MPWKDIQVLDQRMSFIVAYRRGEDSLAAVCRRFGVSRKTGRKWVERYCESGPEGLLDRSRAPHRHPNAVGADIVQLVIMAKHEHPGRGPRKLIPWLRRRHPEIELPAPSTAGEILWRHSMRTVPRSAALTPPPPPLPRPPRSAIRSSGPCRHRSWAGRPPGGRAAGA